MNLQEYRKDVHEELKQRTEKFRRVHSFSKIQLDEFPLRVTFQKETPMIYEDFENVSIQTWGLVNHMMSCIPLKVTLNLNDKILNAIKEFASWSHISEADEGLLNPVKINQFSIEHFVRENFKDLDHYGVLVEGQSEKGSLIVQLNYFNKLDNMILLESTSSVPLKRGLSDLTIANEPNLPKGITYGQTGYEFLKDEVSASVPSVLGMSQPEKTLEHPETQFE